MPRQITVTVPDTVYALLEVLTRTDRHTTVEDVVAELIDHAQQGVYRPGSWERPWLVQAFGDEWQRHLEPGDPHGRAGCERFFDRPRGN